MTADGPDKGTREYEAMSDFMKLYQQNARKYSHLRDALMRIRDYSNMTTIESEFLEEVRQVFGFKPGPQTGGIRYAVQAKRFFTATGGTPDTKEDREKILKLIRPLLESEQDISARLARLMELSRNVNFADYYLNGGITPELLEVFNNVDHLTPELYEKENIADPSFYLPYLLENKLLDFSPYRGKDDTGDEWYFNYRIEITPVPLLTKSFDELAKLATVKYYQARIGLEQSIRQALEGTRPSEKWLREQLHLEGDALEKAMKDYIIKPVSQKALLQFAEAVEIQYKQRIEGQTPLDYKAPFSTEQEAGFYVNPVTRKVYDLRPHRAELQRLFSVKDWNFLQDFANAIREAVKAFKAQVKEKQGQLSITAQKANNLIHAIDKVDENLFAGMFDEKASNQPALFNTVTTKKGQKINVTAYINYEKLPKEITKELTDYDRRVYEAAAAIYNAGNKVTTLTQLYYTMGGAGKPAQKQIEKINQSVTKMMGTLFHIDNQDEVANNINYPKIEYDGALLPMERVTATINGKITESAIHLFREPPLMTFARERKQIFTCSIELLQSPLNISETKFAIEHCLLSLLAMGKHESEKEKKKPEQHRKPVKKEMLLETIYQRAKTTDRRTKPRTKEKIVTLLTHYKNMGQIKDFKLTNDRVILEF